MHHPPISKKKQSCECKHFLTGTANLCFLFDPARTLNPQFFFLAARLVGLFIRGHGPNRKDLFSNMDIECFLKYETYIFQPSLLHPPPHSDINSSLI